MRPPVMESLFLLIFMVFSVFLVSALWALWDSKTVLAKITKLIISFVILWCFVTINNTWNVNKLHAFNNVSVQVSIISSLFSFYFVTVLFNAPSYIGDLREYRLTFKGKVVKILTQLAAVSFTPSMYIWSKVPIKKPKLLGFLTIFAFIVFAGVVVIALIFALIRHVNPVRRALYTKMELYDYINDVLPKLTKGERSILKAIKKEGLISIDGSSNPEEFKCLKGLTKHGIPIIVYKLNNTLLYTFGGDDDIDERMIDGPIQNCEFYSYDGNHLVKKEVIKEISERTGATEKAILKKLEECIDD